MPTDLWMVVAVIQPFRLEAVTLALADVPGFAGMTVTECRGFGRSKLQADARTEADRTVATLVDFTAKVRLEIAVTGRAAGDAVVDTLARSAHTGRPGDGKVFMWEMDRAVRLRTLETDGDAL